MPHHFARGFRQSTFLLQQYLPFKIATTERRESMAVLDVRQTSFSHSLNLNPIPQGQEVFFIKRQMQNLLIKIDRLSRPDLRLLHAAHHTRVACEIERDQGIPWMPVTRFDKANLCLLDILGAPDQIGPD
jgi:hypothetical protein